MLQLARQQDLEAVNALALQAHDIHVRWRPDLFEPVTEPYPQERFEEAVSQRQLYVAKIEEAIVGYVFLRKSECDWLGAVKRRIMIVDEFCVHESCRNQGMGKAMMADVRALAVAFGCTDLQLGVYPQNDAAVVFFQKCGFTIQKIQMQRTV